jgi:endonuclease/exonuclease/phosphatase family metal-dependent hydrolase
MMLFMKTSEYTPPAANPSLRMMSWNIRAGGFDKYKSASKRPERENEIQTVITNQRAKKEIDALSLVDIYRWNEVYGGEAGIAAHLGYAAARYTSLHDKRLGEDGANGIGVAFATNKKIGQSTVLDLGTRCALGVILDEGKYGLQVATAYLSDTGENGDGEEIRTNEVRALHGELEPDIPTIITGDLNGLRRNIRGGRLRHQVADLAVRGAVALLPTSSAVMQAIEGMNQREAIPLLQSYGYHDGDPLKQPTAPAHFPVLGIDYAFHNSGVAIDHFERGGIREVGNASDHLHIMYEATLR